MEYMTKEELGRLLRVAKRENEFHWQMILTGFYFGLRVSEVTAILGEDVQDNQLTVKRLKNSLKTLQRIPLTNGSPEFKAAHGIGKSNRPSRADLPVIAPALRSIHETILLPRGNPPLEGSLPFT